MNELEKGSGAPELTEAEKISEAKRNLSKTASRRLTEKDRAEKKAKTPFVNDPRRSKPQ